jgi:hypothetical protein
MSGRMNYGRPSLRLADNRRQVARTGSKHGSTGGGYIACPSFPKKSGSPTRRGTELRVTEHRRRRKWRKARNVIAAGPSSVKPSTAKMPRKAQGKRLSRRARRAKRTAGLRRIIVGRFSL